MVYKTTWQGQKPDVREKEIEIAKTVGVTFRNLDLVIEALKLTCVDGERCMGDEPVQAPELLPPEFGECWNIAVYSSIKPL